MYVGVDVGGTKTLVATLNSDGVITESRKFPTAHNYEHFLLELRHAVAFLTTKDFRAGGLAIPASHIDREHGVGISFGNLPWRNVHILHDVEKILHCPMVLENDAKLAGLSEAMLLKHDYGRVLYVTISTGIGYGFTVDGQIDTNIGDAGGKGILLPYKGKNVPWESFASGHAIVERYGKRAEDIHDDATWKKIVRDLSLGLVELIAVTQPEVIVIGGSVGTYFERYHHLLTEELKQYHTPLIKFPVFRKAQRPEQAVVYGCYDLAKSTFAEAHQ
jgi:predicted NBD/HSP70 family sugar kinase